MKTGGQLIVEVLEANGVERVFCVPGESYLPVLDALHDSPIRTIVCRQEGGAAMMADCEGRLTGRPGICFVTRGPGATNASPGLMQSAPVRSGQQVYAENRDLTVLGAVGAGAEVIADGSIHIYGALRGRALAGAQGNEDARIFCREFQAELVAVAGHYKVLEDIPKELRGKAVQVWLEKGQLKLAALD